VACSPATISCVPGKPPLYFALLLGTRIACTIHRQRTSNRDSCSTCRELTPNAFLLIPTWVSIARRLQKAVRSCVSIQPCRVCSITTMGAALPDDVVLPDTPEGQTLYSSGTTGYPKASTGRSNPPTAFCVDIETQAGGFRPTTPFICRQLLYTIRPRAVIHGRLRAGTSILMRSSTGTSPAHRSYASPMRHGSHYVHPHVGCPKKCVDT